MNAAEHTHAPSRPLRLSSVKRAILRLSSVNEGYQRLSSVKRAILSGESLSRDPAQKLLSSPRTGALGASLSTCFLLRGTFFTGTASKDQ